MLCANCTRWEDVCVAFERLDDEAEAHVWTLPYEQQRNAKIAFLAKRGLYEKHLSLLRARDALHDVACLGGPCPGSQHYLRSKEQEARLEKDRMQSDSRWHDEWKPRTRGRISLPSVLLLLAQLISTLICVLNIVKGDPSYSLGEIAFVFLTCIATLVMFYVRGLQSIATWMVFLTLAVPVTFLFGERMEQQAISVVVGVVLAGATPVQQLFGDPPDAEEVPS